MEKTNKIILYFITGILVMLMLGAFYKPSGAEAGSTRELSLGKIGGDVRQLQVDLNKKGYNLEPFDGIYGLKTQQAVIDLQKKNHLKPTGVFDRNTGAVLDGKKRTGSKPGTDINRVSRGVSRQDVVTLARVVHGEARGEPFEGQVAVAAVVLNRTRSDQFPKSIKGVVFESGAFDAVSDGQIWLDPDEQSVKAAELALSGYDPTGHAIYYWNPAKTTNRWIWSRPIMKQIGQHVFAK
ncbi:MAG: spore cortex-lytic enzyme [Eubacteriales bacterium]